MRPNISAKVENKQLSQKLHHDNKARERSFAPQDKVYVRKAGSKSPWVPGTIVARNGNVHYEVILDDQRSVRRHIDHIQPRTPAHMETPPQVEIEVSESLDIPCPPTHAYTQSLTHPHTQTHNHPQTHTHTLTHSHTHTHTHIYIHNSPTHTITRLHAHSQFGSLSQVSPAG